MTTLDAIRSISNSLPSFWDEPRLPHAQKAGNKTIPSGRHNAILRLTLVCA
jgi:hypothetical protein